MINVNILLLVILYIVSLSLSSSSCSDPIGCWLQSFSIIIPTITIPVDSTNTLEIDNFLCDNFLLSSLSSSYNKKEPTTLGIDIDGLAVKCIGQYKYLQYSGTITATISNVEAIIDLLIAKNNSNIYPSSISFSSCDVPDGINSIKVNLEFTGSFKTILNLLSGVVEAYIKKSFNTIICTKLADFIAVNGTSFIVNDVDPFLQVLISSEPSNVPIDINNNDEYIHWTSSMISYIMNMIDKLLNSNMMLCLESSYPQLKEILARPVIDYVIDVVTNSTGIINIDMPENSSITIIDGNYSLSISSISITGLDTFTEVVLLEPSLTSNISLNSMIQFDNLDVVVYSTFQSTDSNLYLNDYTEQLEFKVKLYNITMLADVAVGVIKKDFSNLFIDQLFHLDCLLSSGLKYLNITSLIVDVDINDIEIVQVSGNANVLEKNLVSLFNNANMLLNNGYNELITTAIAGITQGPLRKQLNHLISLHQLAPSCPQHVDPTSSDIIRWSDSKLISATVIQADIMNTIVDCFTNETGKILWNIGHWNLSVSNLDSFYDFSSLYPFSDANKAYDLGSSFSVGQCQTGGKCRPLAISLHKEDSSVVSSKLGLSSLSSSLSSLQSSLPALMASLSMFNLSLNMDTTVEFDMNAFKNLQIYQLDVTGCVASSVQVMSINSMSLGAEQISASYIQNGMTITKNITTQSESNSHNSFTLAGVLNSYIEAGLSSASVTCANGGLPVIITDDDSSSSSKSGTIITISAAAGGVLLLTLLFVYYRITAKPVKRLSRDSGSTFTSTWDFSESLINQTHTSIVLRIGLLLLILGNIALFVISNSDEEAVAVMIEIDTTINDKTITVLSPTPVFYFDLVHTVRDMWKAKAYILASLIAFFTGFWPYFKLLFMLAAYTLPSSIISINKRDSRLKILEILGKWSLVDFFVMTLFMIGFHFNIFVSSIEVKVKVIPNMGFYTFVISTALSLVLGHLLLAFHRKSINHPFLDAPGNVNGLRKTGDNDFKERLVDTIYHISISNHESEMNHGPDDNKLFRVILTERFKNFLGGSILFILISILGALFSETIEFKILGLVGLVLGAEGDSIYSLMSLGQTLPNISSGDNGIRVLQFTYFLLVVIMPLALLISIATLAFVPLPLWKQRYIYISMEIFNAWASLDVFLVSSTAALLQIRQLTKYMIGDTCDGIDVYLKKYLDNSLNGDDVCIDLIFTFTSSSSIVFIAAISLFVLSTYCIKLFDKGIHERINLMKKLNRHGNEDNNNNDNDYQHLLENESCSRSPNDKALMVDVSLDYDNRVDCVTNPTINDTVEKFKGVVSRETMTGDLTPETAQALDTSGISNISINELNDLRATLFRDSRDSIKKAANDDGVSKFRVNILKFLMKNKFIELTNLRGHCIDHNSLGKDRVSLSSIISSSSLETRETGETLGVGVSPIIG